jgi:rubrerythrin
MFKKVREILRILQNVHNQVIDYYNHLSDTVKKEQVKILLDHMSRNKLAFKKVIEKYEIEGNQPLLDAWIQYTPEESIKKEVDELETNSDMSIDDVIQIAVDFDDWLENYYRYMSETVASSNLKKVFSNLMETVHKEKLELVSRSNILKDI